MQTGAKQKRDPLSLGIGLTPGSAAQATDETQGHPAVSAGLPSAAFDESPAEISPGERRSELGLSITWASPWREFRSSLRHYFSGERAPLKDELQADSDLRVHWIEGKNSPWAFAASSLWHAAVVTLLVLPIWGFLPATAHNLAPPEIELTWAAPQDLPPIHLQAPDLAVPKPERTNPVEPKVAEVQPSAPAAADTFHPRQTILSIPVRITHPRQTLIQPDAPMAPPKIDPPLPNIVQWSANTTAPKLELQLTASTAAPKMRERRMTAAVAPEIANLEKNSGPLNIASSPVVNPAPQMPMAAMSAAPARFRNRRMDRAAAPELNATGGDASLKNVIALSASPAPPAPVVAVPRGNLAARVAMSPVGAHRGAAGGSDINPRGSGSETGAAGNGSLPASVSVSGGSGRPSASAGGLAPNHASKLMLRPMNSLPVPPRVNPRSGPADVASLAPNAPPEALFSGKEFHTLNVSLPNATSISGSWTLNFAQLDNGSPFHRPTDVLSGPLAIHKVDPRYPVEAIRQNIEGEVVLYAIIRADGSVDSVQVVRHLDPQLDQCAAQALAQWRFRPATRNGTPVDVEAVVHVPFNYKPAKQ